MDNTTQSKQSSVGGTQTMKANSIPLLIGVIIFLILIAFGGYYFFIFHKKAAVNHPAGLSSPNNSTTNSPTPTPTVVQAYVVKPLDCTVQVVHTRLDPPYKGDPPNAGMHYLEVDLSTLCTGKSAGPIQGTFFYKDAAGVLYSAATLHDPTSKYSNKNVSIPGEIPLYSTNFTPGKPVNDAYLLYQVKQGDNGDNGSLEWYNPTAKTQWTNLFFSYPPCQILHCK